MARVISESLPRYVPVSLPIVQTINAEAAVLALKKAIAALDVSHLVESLKNVAGDFDVAAMMFSDSIPYLIKSYASAPVRSQAAIAEILSTLLKSIGDDTKTIDIISKQAVSPDARYRALAVSLIPVVQSMTPKLRNIIFSLTLDRVVTVRCGVVRCLCDSHLDTATIEALIRTSSNDKADQVRKAVAEVIGRLCPSFVNEFCRLLSSPSTVQNALQSLPAMVKANGFSPFLESLSLAVTEQPDTLAMALVAAAEHMRDGEEDLVLELADKLRGNRQLLDRLWELAQFFSDRTPFFSFLDISEAKTWRLRFAVLKQCLNFVELFGSSLVDLAEQFSNDETAIVRTTSAELWARMISAEPHVVYDLERLMTENWQTRMVVAKVIGLVGINDYLRPLATRLSRDPIRNVRYCLATRLLGSEVYEELFSEAEDDEIRQLHRD